MARQRPICTTCSLEMVIDKNGHLAVWTRNGKIVKTLAGDRYRCVGCGARVLVAFADRPSIRHGSNPVRWREHERATMRLKAETPPAASFLPED